MQPYIHITLNKIGFRKAQIGEQSESSEPSESSESANFIERIGHI